MNPKRTCNGCTACCILYTVVDVQKPRHTPCQHLCEQGCAIHDQARPSMCTDFLCEWIIDNWKEGLRPDKCGIVYARQMTLLPSRTHRLIVGTMANPYAHLRRENRKHVERLVSAGHVVLLVFGGSEGEEYYARFDKTRYPTLTTTAIVNTLAHMNRDKLKKNAEFYRQQELVGAATGMEGE
jgi:hypothetical protein